MKKHLYTYFKFIAFWFVILALQRLLFLVYNAGLWTDESPGSVLLAFVHGLKLDTSFLGYVMILPTLLFAVSPFLPERIFSGILRWYTILLLALTWGLAMGDAQLYSHWQLKLDQRGLAYLSNPMGMIASVSWWFILLGMLAIAGFTYGSLKILTRYVIVKDSMSKTRPGILSLPVFVVLTSLLFLPIRGGFDLHPVQMGLPISISAAYYQENAVLNHAAYNVPWYVAHSYLEKPAEQYSFLEPAEANGVYEQLYAKPESDSVRQLVGIEKPNVVVLVLESFTYHLVEEVGGLPKLSPTLNTLAKEGLVFDNFYATGIRSEMGIVSIFSGAPSLPHKCIMRDLRQVRKLSFLFDDLGEEGYSTGFYYGGDMSFCNFKAYFSEAGIQNVVGKDQFEVEEQSSSWGVPDHIVLGRMAEELKTYKQPFCTGLFTLSNHTPYDVPMEPVIDVEGEVGQFLNSAYYTDKSVGEFVSQLKSNGLWENTLLVITADHSCNFLSQQPRADPDKFKVPLIMTGGALQLKGRISKVASQTDITPTILAALGVKFESEDYPFGQNILSSSGGKAYYAYGEGVGYLDEDVVDVYDINKGAYYKSEGIDPKKGPTTSQVLLQVSSEMYGE